MTLFFKFIVRPLIADRIRTATTVVGVALGIAVVIAIQLTNESSVRGFARALETVAGQTSVEVVGSGVGIDETLLPSLGALREFGLVSPVIEGSAVLVVEGDGFSRRRSRYRTWWPRAISTIAVVRRTSNRRLPNAMRARNAATLCIAAAFSGPSGIAPILVPRSNIALDDRPTTLPPTMPAANPMSPPMPNIKPVRDDINDVSKPCVRRQ